MSATQARACGCALTDSPFRVTNHPPVTRATTAPHVSTLQAHAARLFLDTRDWKLETRNVGEHVQTKREIESTLAAAGLRPRKRFGQHFLIDGNLMRRLVDSAELTPDDLVLEVGPGTGGLTDLLVRRAGRVICVEIDRDLAAVLAERFRGVGNITLIQGDVLRTKHLIMPEVAEVIRKYSGSGEGCVKLVANLPYQSATPLVMNLLVDFPQVRRLCFTVQAEVGERILSQPNCKAYGPLSIIAQTLCTIETVARIGPQSFWPRPEVHSVMLRMDALPSPFADHADRARFAALVRGAFEHRRKTLRSALAYVLDEPAMTRVCKTCDVSRRPEQLTVQEWVSLFRAGDD